MIQLSKENLLDYVKGRLDFFDPDGDIRISEIGDGSVEEDGDGFINFVFRISDGTHHLIVKQSTVDMRSQGDLNIDINRYRFEYESMMIRRALVPDLLPEIYDIDDENRVFIMEDVSHLRIVRFQLNKGVMYPKLADQIGRYMAASGFYTSRYYLDSKTFRGLEVHFMNMTMRRIMEDHMFLTSLSPEDTVGSPLDPDFERFSRLVMTDENLILSRVRLRHLFMTKAECLIHGDLHTSNIFAGPDDCKVIDMEYTFAAPFSYDMGYFLGNFLAQYCAAVFRPFPSEEDRNTYKEYCLFMLKETYLKFCSYFISYCHEDSRPEYKNIPGLEEDFCLTTLREFTGFAASANIGRITGQIPYPDFDSIENPIQRHNAMCLNIILDRTILLKWDKYNNIDEFISDIQAIEAIYCRNIRELNK